MRILLTCDTSTNPNLGCQANTDALYKGILKYDPDADIDRITLSQLLERKPIRLVERTHRKGKCANHTSTGLRMSKYDIVIINGEGSVDQYDHNRLAVVPQHLFKLIKSAKKEGVRPYMVNFTHNIPKGKNNELALNAYADCVGVSVREPISFHRLKDLCKNVKLFPDLTCTHQKADVERENIIMVGGGTCLKTTHCNTSLAAYNRIVRQLLKYDYDIVLVGWPSLRKGDDCFFNQFVKTHKLPVKHVNIVCFKDYIELCSRSVLNITGRHHGTTMSFVSGCPFMPIAAQNLKVNGDNILYGRGERVMKLTDDDLEDQIDYYVNHIEESTRRIQGRYEELKPYFDGHIKQIWHKDTPGL